MTNWERVVKSLTKQQKVEIYCEYRACYSGECKFYKYDNCKKRVEKWIDKEEENYDQQ